MRGSEGSEPIFKKSRSTPLVTGNEDFPHGNYEDATEPGVPSGRSNLFSSIVVAALHPQQQEEKPLFDCASDDEQRVELSEDRRRKIFGRKLSSGISRDIFPEGKFLNETCLHGGLVRFSRLLPCKSLRGELTTSFPKAVGAANERASAE